MFAKRRAHESPILPTSQGRSRRRRGRGAVDSCRLLARRYGQGKGLLLAILFLLVIGVVVSTWALKGRIIDSGAVPVSGATAHRQARDVAGKTPVRPEQEKPRTASERRSSSRSRRSELKKLLADKKAQHEYGTIQGIPLYEGDIVAKDGTGRVRVKAVLDHSDPAQNNNVKNNKKREPDAEIPRPPKPTSQTLKIFGVGLSKTGTSSLANGLSRMGLRTIHSDMDRMRGLLSALGNQFDTIAQNITRQQAKDQIISNLDFSGMYDDVDAVVDAPMYLFWEQLFAAYPDAKFILTVRDPQSWFHSAKEFFRFFFQKLCGGVVPKDTAALHTLTYGSAIPDNDSWQNAFEAHVESIRAKIPANQLLIIDLEKEGNSAMGKVCRFVRPAAGSDICGHFALRPFPKLNVAASSLQRSVDHRGTCFHRQHVRSPFATPQTAYVTVLSNLNDGSRHGAVGYVYSTLVAIRSLLHEGLIRRATDPLPTPKQQRDPNGPKLLPEFVVVTVGYLCHNDRALFETAGARVLNFPAIPFPDFRTSDSIPQSVESMAANNQKLHVFGLGHMYHTVLYIDADVIATAPDASKYFDLLEEGMPVCVLDDSTICPRIEAHVSALRVVFCQEPIHL